MNMYRNPTAKQSIAGRRAGVPAAVLVAACVAFGALPGPAAAMQMLAAADHAEIEAAVSAAGVSRIAVANDRIRRVIRSPGGFDVEHDAASGDLYLRPLGAPDPAWDELPVDPLPLTLFLGTEQGFTYRLTLIPDARPSAQVLIRNPAAAAGPTAPAASTAPHDARVAELVRLVRAAARREIPPGYLVEAARSGPHRHAIETWRGTRFTAHVLAAGPDTDADALADRFGPAVAAAWVSSPPDRETQERIAVVVTEPGRPGADR